MVIYSLETLLDTQGLSFTFKAHKKNLGVMARACKPSAGDRVTL